ncbi:hypothetical protein PCE1_002235 [Barthelona sp. PCE]
MSLNRDTLQSFVDLFNQDVAQAVAYFFKLVSGDIDSIISGETDFDAIAKGITRKINDSPFYDTFDCLFDAISSLSDDVTDAVNSMFSALDTLPLETDDASSDEVAVTKAVFHFARLFCFLSDKMQNDTNKSEDLKGRLIQMIKGMKDANILVILFTNLFRVSDFTLSLNSFTIYVPKLTSHVYNNGDEIFNSIKTEAYQTLMVNAMRSGKFSVAFCFLNLALSCLPNLSPDEINPAFARNAVFVSIMVYRRPHDVLVDSLSPEHHALFSAVLSGDINAFESLRDVFVSDAALEEVEWLFELDHHVCVLAMRNVLGSIATTRTTASILSSVYNKVYAD